MNPRPKLFTLLLPLFAFACCGPEPARQNQETPATHPQPSGEANPEATAKIESTAKMTDDTKPAPNNDASDKVEPAAANKEQVATFGGGCFWCTEAVLEQLDGVLSVESGYTGGVVDNPTYEQICSGTTEHAEVVRVTFDASRLSYEKLLEWFFRSHDPTTLNRQGNDVGTQYRSAIFYHSDEQRRTANNLINQIEHNWSDPVVTEVTEAPKFWSAEKYHQDYFRNNQNQGYCRAIILPKLSKLGLDTTPKPGKAPAK